MAAISRPQPTGPADYGPGPERRQRPASAGRATEAMPGIIDAVRDQDGVCWIRYGAPGRAIWFSLPELVSQSLDVFRRVSTVDSRCLMPTSQSGFKRRVEEHSAYRDALVASRPGWLDGHYVFGDATFISPRSDDRKVIVTADPNPKFSPQGTLAEWQAEIGPLVTEQPLLFFSLAFAFVGPILRFAPSHYHNPQAELVSRGEIGKSTVGKLAASVWAGNSGADSGGGETWHGTLNSLDTLKRDHRDGLLFIDEFNLAGDSAGQRREIGRQAVFQFASTAGKRRMGDPPKSEHARIAVLSTTNSALAEVLQDTPDVRDAALSRMLTLRIANDAPNGVFDHLPEGYRDARRATEALDAAVNRSWGSAAEAFVAELVKAAERNEAGLRRLIEGGLERYMQRDRIEVRSARIQKTLAITAVAASLAQRYGVMRSSWGSPLAMIQAVAAGLSPSTVARIAPSDRIAEYVKRHRSEIVDVSTLRGPLLATAFGRTPGFLRDRDGRTELLVPAGRFQETFPDYQDLMRELRTLGLAVTEGGRQAKLTIKAPRSICREGRVYCVVFSR